MNASLANSEASLLRSYGETRMEALEPRHRTQSQERWEYELATLERLDLVRAFLVLADVGQYARRQELLISFRGPVVGAMVVNSGGRMRRVCGRPTARFRFAWLQDTLFV